MKKAYLSTNSDEPIGIIITRGTTAEPRPTRFSAYVWGMAPDTARPVSARSSIKAA